MRRILGVLLGVMMMPVFALAYSCAVLDTNTVKEGGIIIVKVSSSARLQAGEIHFMDKTYPLFFHKFDRQNMDFEFLTVVPVPLETSGTRKMTILWMADNKEREQTENIKIKSLKLPSSTVDTNGRAGSMASNLPNENKLIAKKQEKITKAKYVFPFIMPVQGEITSAFGKPRTYDSGAGWRHKGLDIAAKEGTAIGACSNGTVAAAAATKAHGNIVIVDHGGGVYSLYEHMRGVSVKPGQSVKAGDRVGSVGSTGIATGAHLHWQMNVFGIAVDPQYFLTAR